MANARCFMIERTMTVERGFRIYEGDDCKGNFSFHNSYVKWDICKGILDKDGFIQTDYTDYDPGDSRFKLTCDSCGRPFTDKATRQLFVEELYTDGKGNLWTIRNAPPGAMWNAWWMTRGERRSNLWIGPDGLALMCKLPNGSEWHIDGQASNCTMKEDFIHKCWVRHGTPPNLTVDKNGFTCAAGAGSILSGNWHGFLIAGELRQC